jgi:hypothetical protein
MSVSVSMAVSGVDVHDSGLTSLSSGLRDAEGGDRRQADDLATSQRFEERLKAAGDDAPDRVVADLDGRDSGSPLDLARRRRCNERDLDSPGGSVVEHARRVRPATGGRYRRDYVFDA